MSSLLLDCACCCLFLCGCCSSAVGGQNGSSRRMSVTNNAYIMSVVKGMETSEVAALSFDLDEVQESRNSLSSVARPFLPIKEGAAVEVYCMAFTYVDDDNLTARSIRLQNSKLILVDYLLNKGQEIIKDRRELLPRTMFGIASRPTAGRTLEQVDKLKMAGFDAIIVRDDDQVLVVQRSREDQKLLVRGLERSKEGWSLMQVVPWIH